MSGKSRVMGHGTRVSRYAFIAGPENIGRRPELQTCVFLWELAHGMWMRTERDHDWLDGC